MNKPEKEAGIGTYLKKTLKNVLDDNEPITEKIVINSILHSIIDILLSLYFLKYFYKSLFNAPKGVT